MENELYHHGVNGMRWGKRNGPPYPLDAEGKAELREQRKAEKQEKKDLEKQVKNSQEYKNNKEVNSIRAHKRVMRDTRLGGLAGLAAGAAIAGPMGAAAGVLAGAAVSSITSGAVNAGRKVYENGKFKDMKVSELQSQKKNNTH